jgi:hypothetical protein
VRFAYADPPYLGQGASRYGHLHPDAAVWDDPATHTALVERLEVEYPDGWAISLTPQPEAVMAYVGPGRELAVWHRRGWMTSRPQMRISFCFELVLYRTAVPNMKKNGPMVANVFTLGGQNWQLGKQAGTHTGTKPEEFCHWVLDLLGYNPETDQIDDLFPGEGSMTRAAAQHRLNLWDPGDKAKRRSWHPGGTEKLAL